MAVPGEVSPQRLHRLRRGDRCWQGVLGRKVSPRWGRTAGASGPGSFSQASASWVWLALAPRPRGAAGSGLGSGCATGTLSGAEDGEPGGGEGASACVSAAGGERPVPLNPTQQMPCRPISTLLVPEALVWLPPHPRTVSSSLSQPSPQAAAAREGARLCAGEEVLVTEARGHSLWLLVGGREVLRGWGGRIPCLPREASSWWGSTGPPRPREERVPGHPRTSGLSARPGACGSVTSRFSGVPCCPLAPGSRFPGVLSCSLRPV